MEEDRQRSMEEDPERPYSVLTRDEVREMMKKQIDAISEIFCVSRSDATVLLLSFQWDSIRVSERLSENKEKLLTESGLKSVVNSGLKSIVIDSNRDLSDSSCDVFYEFDDDNDDSKDVDDLISTPICSHKFRTSYWREHLEENLNSLETPISCPNQDCRVSVGPDTIEKLTVEDKEMYERYVLRSYLGGIKKEMIKQCPAPDCEYVIEFYWPCDLEEHSSNVVCLCGHIFCWRCEAESHVPVTCNNASDWLSRDLTNLIEELNQSSSLSWIETNTKPCPHCLCPVEFDDIGFNRFLTCACSDRFCRKCSHSEESHIMGSGFFAPCPEPEILLGSREKVDISCVDRWEACEISMAEAKSNLRAFEESIIKKNPRTLMKQDITNMREGLMLVVQCRQVLKWICVYDYLFTGYEMSKKEYLRYLQDNATALVQSYSEALKEATEKAFSDDTFEEFTCFRGKLSTAKSDIGNYFYHFMKALQDGFADVKVRSYDNFGGPYWFCDRCTYGNTWFIKECKMCCDPTAPMEEISD